MGIMNILKLYIKFVKIFIRSKVEYRFGMIFELISNFVLIGVYFVGMYVIFYNFNNVNGWKQYEFIFMFTFNWLSYSISSFFFWMPMLKLGEMITSGEFDSFLIRPISPFVYLIFRQFQYTFLPRLILALIFFIYSISKIYIVWTAGKIAYLILSIITGVVIHSGIFVLIGSTSFWVLQNSELTSILTNNDYGLRTYADYPISMFNKFVQAILVFVIPYAMVAFYPATYLLGKNGQGILQNILQYMFPIFAIVIALLASIVWKKGINRYGSSGN